MKILVCISIVPDTTTKITFTENNTHLNTAGIQYILNPYDEIALARALELAEGGKATVTVLHVGTATAEPTIRKALAIGADDAIRIDTAPKDAYSVAFQIAEAIKETGYDLLFFGRESIDYNGAKVCAMVAELCNIPSVSIIKRFSLEAQVATMERETEAGKEIVSCPLPVAVSCMEGVAEPKIPNMRGIMSARTKPLTVLPAVDVPSLEATTFYKTPEPRGQVALVEASQPERLIELLHSHSKVI